MSSELKMLQDQNASLCKTLKEQEIFMAHARATLRRDSFVQRLVVENDRLKHLVDRHPGELVSAYLRGSEAKAEMLNVVIAEQTKTIDDLKKACATL